jgi:thioredoxin reductase (NADPH)
MAIRMRRNKLTLPTSTGPSHHDRLSRRWSDHLIRQWVVSGSLLVALLGWFEAPSFVSYILVGTTSTTIAGTSSSSSSSRHHHRSLILQNVESYDYDVIVIGSGPAGMTSALYAGRSGWSVLVIGSIHDSVLAEATRLDNIPGVAKGTTGLTWLTDTQSNLVQQNSRIAWAQPALQATGLQPIQDGGWKVELGPDYYSLSRAIIVASGSVPRRLNLPTEDALWGKSVHSCAVCDGSAYETTATVVVVGGGDAAVDAALYLQRIVKQVILVHRRHEFRTTNQQNLQLLREKKNVQVETPYVVSNYELANNGKLVGVTLTSADAGTIGSSPVTRSVPCEGVFLLLGSTPNTGFVGDVLQLDADGYIIITNHQTGEASLPGVYAAGDVIDRLYHQAITSAGAGAQAAMNAEHWLRQQQNNNTTRTVQVTNLIPMAAMAQEQKQRHAAVAAVAVAAEMPKVVERGDYGEGCNLTLPDCIQTIIHRHPIVVFSKPWCPYCKKALSILALYAGTNPHVINLINNDAPAIQATLSTLSNGRRTVPNVFVNGKSIGGGDDVGELHNSRKLKTLLEQAKAIAR